MLMGPIDFILNLAGLLLWLSWRSVQYDPLTKRTPATLLGTLRPAETTRWRQWHLPAVIIGLLIFRALIYWLVGSTGHWVGRLDFGVISPAIHFRGHFSDLFLRIIPYSCLSFALTLGVFYLWLLFLSILAGPDPIHRLVRVQLGAVDRWPRWVKWLLPLVVTGAFWWLTTWLFAKLEVSDYSKTHFIPEPVSGVRRLESAAIVGGASYLVWKYVIGALLLLHLLNTYIYFGKHPLWNYVNITAHTLLGPLGKIPLRVERVDFAPVVGLALVFFIPELLGRWLAWLYERVAF